MSKLVIWQDYFSVQVAEIDDQHKQLISILNELNELFENNNDKENIGLIIDQLIDYAAKHFRTEEKYFVKFHYRNSSAHFAEHSQFIKQVHAFKNEYAINHSVLTPKILSFLRDWVNHHIMESDQMYVECFVGNGLQ